MQKVLVICGPTATGKTKLALQLAKKLNGEVISADSRQVYKYLDIVTGKDKELLDKDTKIWGYDIVEPNEDFSAKLYSDFAQKTIEDILYRNKLPIIEGGTGFYIDAALKNMEHITVPKNTKLREKYKNLSANELFSIYMKVAPTKAILLNDSDRKNSRRLIRILEKADFEMRGYALEESDMQEKYETTWIGLNYNSREELYSQIDKRVDARLGEDLKKEIEFLKTNGFYEKASQTTPGYKYWDNPEKWKIAEHQYAKRQITWFRRNKKITWFDANDPDLCAKIESQVNDKQN